MSVGGPPTGALKEHLFHFILDWQIATPSVKSRQHGAELIRSRESDKRLTYAPFRLLPDETVSTEAKLSLAFDGIALAQIAGRKSPEGRIIHGRKYVRVTVSLGPYYGKAQALIAKIASRTVTHWRPHSRSTSIVPNVNFSRAACRSPGKRMISGCWQRLA